MTNKNTFINPLFEAHEEYQKKKAVKDKEYLETYSKLTPHQKFSLWVKFESWDLKNEAIPLIMGVSPDYVHILSKNNKFNINSAQKVHKLALASIGENLSLQIINSKEKEHNWRVHKTHFIKWAISKNLNVSQSLLEINEKINPHELIGESTKKITNFTYTTPLLKIVEYVIEEYWEGLEDFTKVLSKEDMVEHLVNKYSISNREAIAVDAITRHPKKRNKT